MIVLVTSLRLRNEILSVFCFFLVGQPVRQKWTVEEEKELRVLFSVNILTKKCPKKHEIEKAVRKSMKNGGLINLKKPDNIKKQMSNMIIKLKYIDMLKMTMLLITRLNSHQPFLRILLVLKHPVFDNAY